MPERAKNDTDLLSPDLSGEEMHSIEMSFNRRLLEHASPELKTSLKVLKTALRELERSISPDGFTPWSEASGQQLEIGNAKLEVALRAAAEHLVCCGVSVAQGRRGWERIVQILPGDHPDSHPLNLMAHRLLRIDSRYLLGFSPAHSAHHDGAVHTHDHLIVISKWMAFYAFSREDRSDTSLGHEVSHALHEKRLNDQKDNPYFGKVVLVNGTFPLVYAGYENAMSFSEIPAFKLEVNRHLINWKLAKEANDDISMENTRIKIIEDSSSGVQLCKNTLWVLDRFAEARTSPSDSLVEVTLLAPERSEEIHHHQLKARCLIGTTEAIIRIPVLDEKIEFSDSAIGGELSQLFKNSARLLRAAAASELAFFEKAYNTYRLRHIAKSAPEL